MSSAVPIDLFVEDRAHEALLVPLIRRIASQEGVDVDLRVRSARGGHGKAIGEFRVYQQLLEKAAIQDPPPALIVVGIDGNCVTYAMKRSEIQDATRASFRDRVVAACPDPHIERWFLADAESFHEVVGHRPAVGRKKCARDHYKQLLGRAIRDGGHPTTLGGIEFAAELVDRMDLYRAGKADGSLKAFVEDLRAKLHGMVRDERGNAG